MASQSGDSVAVTNSVMAIATEERRASMERMMEPYANWEQGLISAPVTIAILGEIISISTTCGNISMNRNPPKGGFKYLRYPDSFKASLMQVSNDGWQAFNTAYTNMDQIRLLTLRVPKQVETIHHILSQRTLADKCDALLDKRLKTMESTADQCKSLALEVEAKFIEVMNVIQELLEAGLSAKGEYEKEQEEIKAALAEAKIKEKSVEEAKKRIEEKQRKIEEQLKGAQEEYRRAMNSMPTERIFLFFEQFARINKEAMALKLEASKMHLKDTEERYQQNFKEIENINKDLTDILYTMRNREIKEDDLKTAMTMLSNGMSALGKVRVQWGEMVCFFQLMSNQIKISLSDSMKEFIEMVKDVQETNFDPSMLMLMNTSALDAADTACLVHMISGAYTEVFHSHVMGQVSRLGGLLTIDQESPAFTEEFQKFRNECQHNEHQIKEMLVKKKADVYNALQKRMSINS